MPLELTAAEKGIVGRHLVETSNSIVAASGSIRDIELLLNRRVPFEELPEQLRKAVGHLSEANTLLNEYAYPLLQPGRQGSLDSEGKITAQ